MSLYMEISYESDWISWCSKKCIPVKVAKMEETKRRDPHMVVRWSFLFVEDDCCSHRPRKVRVPSTSPPLIWFDEFLGIQFNANKQDLCVMLWKSDIQILKRRMKNLHPNAIYFNIYKVFERVTCVSALMNLGVHLCSCDENFENFILYHEHNELNWRPKRRILILGAIYYCLIEWSLLRYYVDVDYGSMLIFLQLAWQLWNTSVSFGNGNRF